MTDRVGDDATRQVFHSAASVNSGPGSPASPDHCGSGSGAGFGTGAGPLGLFSTRRRKPRVALPAITVGSVNNPTSAPTQAVGFPPSESTRTILLVTLSTISLSTVV